MCKCRRVVVVVVAVAILALACNFSFAASFSWNGSSVPGRLWSVEANWYPGPGLPATGDEVYVAWAGLTNPLIDSTVTAYCENLRVGQATGNTIDMTGGSLTVATNFILGQYGPGTLNLSGGIVTAGYLWTGDMTSDGMGLGTVNMTGGTINTTQLLVDRYGGAGYGVGVHLDGGVINADDIYFGAGYIDITAGKLVLPSSLQGTVQGYIGQSWLTGYGNKDNVRITTVGDKIEVTAVPEPVTLALLGFGSLALLRRKRA